MNSGAISVTFTRPHSTTDWERLALIVEFRPRDLAKQCGVSLRTLQRLFRSRYEMSLSEWLRSVRMRQAYIRLRSGHRIKEVAYSLGFKQLSHFSREFKKEFGVSPSAFRQSTFGAIHNGASAPAPAVRPESQRELVYVFSPGSFWCNQGVDQSDQGSVDSYSTSAQGNVDAQCHPTGPMFQPIA